MADTTHTICGYAVTATMRPECTFMAAGAGGRQVVLKRLEADCLLHGELHPSVRERLERVREVAHAGVANLHGVAIEGGQAWLIWEYLPGQTLDAHAADPARTLADVRSLARELALTVDSLHEQGIVHGALVPGNVLVSSEPGGAGESSQAVRLTHVSPLLFSDPAVDSASVVALLEHVLDHRGHRDGWLGNLLAEARSTEMSLAALASRLAVEPAATTGSDRGQRDAAARGARRWALAAAAAMTAIALAGGALLWRRLEPKSPAATPIAPGTEIPIRR